MIFQNINVTPPTWNELRNKSYTSYYVPRTKLENKCLDFILQELNQTILVRIYAPKRFGKTHFLHKIKNKVCNSNFQIVSLDFNRMDTEDFRDSETFLKAFCLNILEFLGKTINFEKWNNKQNIISCQNYFENYILSKETQILLIIDHVEKLFAYENPFKDFARFLKVCYDDSSTTNEIFINIRFLIAYSTNNYPKLEPNESPFNVMYPIDLMGFDSNQIEELLKTNNLSYSSDEINNLMEKIGGHPQLIDITIKDMKINKLNLSQFLNKLDQIFNAPKTTDFEPYRKHLNDIWREIDRLELKGIIKNVISYPLSQGMNLDSFQQVQDLKSIGLVETQNGNHVKICSELYYLYFKENL
jgi:hypothetical protein